MVTWTNRGDWRRSLAGEPDTGLAALLFVLLGPPLAWTLHFLAIYFLVALYCTTGRTSVTVEVLIATAAAAAASLAAGVTGYRRWRRVCGDQSWAEAVTGGMSATGFFLIMGVLGAAFFTLLIVLEGLPPLFVPPCSGTESG